MIKRLLDIGFYNFLMPFVESGELACTLLLDRLSGPSRAVQHVNLPAELIVRSTA